MEHQQRDEHKITLPVCFWEPLNNVINTKMLGEITDEVVPWEVNQPCNLMNAIFSQVVNLQVLELRKEKCCGCKIDHPSQRRHDCLMMTEEEG